ncbi:hypothetical protein CLV33_109112 [Jejuia pallidilutea]|uniref:Lipocalin-like domain-containing protein n=2 Tax=Jejuia pallidilutea TaxID=504487 RepID=A0A362WXT5_9FLAO|nr:hypothetical protein [Jejuia pallidilutea]PQV46614.1 hypothetical protein CLV33_109112 [Jejuia pallidilutea]
MKTKLKFLVLLPFFALLMFTSCQEETVDITPPDEAEALVADSQLTSFLSATSKNDGSKDNIIDRASCISIKLPVIVKVRGIEIKISSEADYELIEKLYDQFDDDDDRCDIIFPITIINAEHDEIVINNADELESFIEVCSGENEEDDDIECIDFQYPISFSVYNTTFEIIDTVTIENDRQLHKFIKRVKNAEVFASLNFPVTMVLADGTTLEANNNEELQNIIADARDTCDEDDDNDYNDDDFTKERLDEYLKKCPWVVYEYKRYNQDNTQQYGQYAINFQEEGVVTMKARSGDVLTGSWSTTVTNRGALLKMEFESLADFTLEWFVYDFEDGKIKIYQEGGNRIVLKRSCNVVVDITKERVENFLKECLWRVAELEVNDTDKEEEYIGTPLKFYANNIVKIRVNGELVEGTYEVLVRNTGIGLEINLEGRPDLKLQWLITFLSEDEIELKNADNEMELKRHCPDNDGDLNFILDALVSSEWEVASYIDEGEDETPNYKDYVIGFNQSGMLFAEGNGNDYRGSWLAYRYDGLNLALNFKTQEAPFNELRYRWKIKEITMERIELKDYSDNGEIERILVLERRVI